jgi:Uma2 family endonuclease
MIAQVKAKLTLEEYLVKERQAETKSEFIDGVMVAMTGASRKHNVIAVNILARLHAQLRQRTCEVYGGDMRVGVEQAELYTYPDVVVVCGDPQFLDLELDTLLNPTVIIEVLSSSTASYDRGEKFHHYRQLSSLQDYLLISQDQIGVEHYSRQGDHTWLLSDIQDPSSVVSLASIDCSLLVGEIYEKIRFTDADVPIS